MTDDDEGKEMGNVIRIDEGRIKDHRGEMVLGTVEEALSGWCGRSLKSPERIYVQIVVIIKITCF